MPIFKYSCRTCGHDFAELVRWGFGSKVPCPKCGNERPDRQRIEFTCVCIDTPAKKDEEAEPLPQVA